MMLDDYKENDSPYKLVPKLTVTHNTGEVFCVKFSPDGDFVVAGGGDGSIRVFNSQTGVLSNTLKGGSSIALPTTSIRFRPTNNSTTSQAKNVFLTTSASGLIQHWHLSSGKCLHSLEEEDKNQVYCLDYDSEGTRFVTAGRDRAVRVYDEATKSIITTMRGGQERSLKDTPGHSNRIFTAKFFPNDENVILSGGWDNSVQFWDIRIGCAVRAIYGPHICGDSIDIVDRRIVTGSWRNNYQIEIWDYISGDKLEDVPWSATADPTHSCMVYATQFSKEGRGNFIVAGGSGVNEVKVFDCKRDYVPVGTITGLARGVFSVDFAVNEQKFAFGCGDASLRIVDIIDRAK